MTLDTIDKVIGMGSLMQRQRLYKPTNKIELEGIDYSHPKMMSNCADKRCTWLVSTKWFKMSELTIDLFTCFCQILSPDNPTNDLLLEVDLHMWSTSNKSKLNKYMPPSINLG